MKIHWTYLGSVQKWWKSSYANWIISYEGERIIDVRSFGVVYGAGVAVERRACERFCRLVYTCAVDFRLLVTGNTQFDLLTMLEI